MGRWCHTSQANPQEQDIQLPARVKPFSDIPVSSSHWLFGVFEIMFQNGGMHRSFYKIQEDSIR